jgi:hypothetical protein
MIHVVMFDLGGTLVDQNRRPFPHAKSAVEAISGFKAAGGKRLKTCLVSDFDLADPPATPAKIKAIFVRYLAVLDETGLRPLFEPAAQRATLSTHAGVMKPDRKVFETALKRLKFGGSLKECLLITEDAGHIAHARGALGMQALRFGGSGNGGFSDWADAPALVAALAAPGHEGNEDAAIKAAFAAKNIDVVSVERPKGGGHAKVSGHAWVDAEAHEHEGLKGVQIAVPVTGTAAKDSHGRFNADAAPSADAVDEARTYVKGLAANRKIAGLPGTSAPSGATHQVETAADGRLKLSRKRFSAL